MTMRAFDPGDSFDAMAESFRRKVAGMAVEAYRVTIYRDLPPVKQLECFMCGVTVGLIGVCFASIQKEGRDEMMKAIIAYLEQAREQAEGVVEPTFGETADAAMED